jgi:hypothetical protein
VFIDPVKVFKLSEVLSVPPILGRLYSVQPCSKSKEGVFCSERPTPFIVGFCHGRDKPPNVHSFLQPMLNEFDRLCPDIDDVIPLRSCTASLRCVIADSPMRSYLKGTTGHSGYWACDRCIQRGEIVKKLL